MAKRQRRVRTQIQGVGGRSPAMGRLGGYADKSLAGGAAPNDDASAESAALECVDAADTHVGPFRNDPGCQQLHVEGHVPSRAPI